MTLNKLINLNVSYQENVWSSLKDELTLRKIIKIIKNEKLKGKIEHLRELIRNNKIEDYNILKKSLPAVCFCGTFHQTRKMENLKNYNSLIVIDIDKLDQQNISLVDQTLREDKYIFSHWKSPSGKGFKGLALIDYSQELKKNELTIYHKIAFQELTLYFQKKYKIELDISGSDISRLCFLSADKNLHFKRDIHPFTISISDSQIKLQKKIKKVQQEISPSLNKISNKNIENSDGRNNYRDKKTMIKIIKFLVSNNLSITSNYVNWYRVAYSIANTFTSDLGEKFFLTICRLDESNHDENGSINLLRYCYQNSKGDISFSTIVYLAKEKGFIIRG